MGLWSFRVLTQVRLGGIGGTLFFEALSDFPQDMFAPLLLGYLLSESFVLVCFCIKPLYTSVFELSLMRDSQN
jgi:hypothetical protein